MTDEQSPIIGGMPTTSDSPADLRAQVGEIMRDPMWGRNPALTEKVDALYRAHYGKDKVDLGSGIEIEGDPAKATGHDAPTDTAWLQEAKRDLGGDFESAKERVKAVGDKFFPGDAAAQEKAIEGLLAAGMTEREIFDMLRK